MARSNTQLIIERLHMLTIPRVSAWQVGSTIIAQAAGVPTLPWSGSGVAIDYAACKGVVPVRCLSCAAVVLYHGNRSHLWLQSSPYI